MDLTVHNAQTHSHIILISLTARNGVAFIYSVTICQQETTDFASSGSFQHKLQYRCFLFDQCLLSFITTGNKSTLSSVIDGFLLRRKMWQLTENVTLTRNKTTSDAKCNINPKCNNFWRKMWQLFNAKCNRCYDVIKLQSQNSEVLQILIYTRVKINK